MSALAANSKIAVAKGTTWLTPAALGADSRLPILNESLDAEPGVLEDDTIVDCAERAEPDLLETRGEGDIACIVDPRQAKQLLLMALFFGNNTVSVIEATKVWKHAMLFQPSTLGKFFTYGAHRDVGALKAFRLASAKISQLVLSGAAGGRLEATYSCLGAGADRTQDPSSWTYATDPKGGGARHLLFRHGKIRMNAFSGGALGTADELATLRAWTLTMDRALVMDFAAGGDAIEPEPDGFADLKLRCEFFSASQALVDLLRAAKENGTPLKADGLFTGPDVVGTAASNKYQGNLYLPYLRVTEAKLGIPQPGRIPFTVEFSLHKAPSVPTGFPAGYDEAVCMEMQSENETDPLA